MFERYTERAQQIISYARYEASEFGSSFIESEHLALAVLSQKRPLFDRILGDPAKSAELDTAIRCSLERGAKISTSVDLPLSDRAKRMLAYATEEAERLQDPTIGSLHLLLGLLREQTKTSAMLQAAGITAEVVGGKELHPRTPTSASVAKELQTEFAPLAARLSPEIEPAVVFSFLPASEGTGE